MNIFVLARCPRASAHYMCDMHVPKMVVESCQMMASALRRHGATDDDMPLTQAGKPYKGGYANHPCTVWAGQSRANFEWLSDHCRSLLSEFRFRFHKSHFCETPWQRMADMYDRIPERYGLTPFAQAMPDQYQHHNVVTAYRRYYKAEKTFATWDRGRRAPRWWR